MQIPCDVDVYVRLEEVTRADAPATRVAEAVLSGVHLGRGPGSIPFELHNVATSPGGHYSVRVHVDVDRDGKISRGDYVSTQSHSLASSTDSARNVNVVVREVR